MKKNFKLLLVCTLLVVCQLLSSVLVYCESTDSDKVEVGSYVQLGVYDGTPMLWQVINIDSDGNLMLWSEYGVGEKSFDARKYSTPVDFTLEAWDKSTIRTWLNSDSSVVNYSGQSPDVGNAENPYDTEPGFLTCFSDFEKSIIMESQYKWAVYHNYVGKTDGGSETYKFSNMNLAPNQALLNYDNSYYINLSDKVFLLSVKELHDFVSPRGLGLVKRDASGADIVEFRLRTPALLKENPLTVHKSGFITDSGGFYSGYYGTDVIPAMYIDIRGLQIKGFGTKASPYVFTSEVQFDTLIGMSSWSKSIIEEAYNNGLLTNNTQNGFKDTITREEYAELSIKLYENITGREVILDSENPFKDTNNKSVASAYSLGIVNGTTNNTFSPNDFITREQMAVMFYRTIKKAIDDLSDLRKSADFCDNNSISPYALESVEYLSSYGIINGVGGDRFNPNGTATKEEAIAIMMRIAKGADIFDTNSSYPKTIALGYKGSIISDIQQKLNQFCEINGEKAIEVTGVFDKSTKSMVSKFQNKLSLSVTEKLNEETYLAIMNDGAWDSTNVEISFPDKELERLVRTYINKSEGPIYSRDVLGIKYFDINYGNKASVKNLEGIQWLKNLSSLSLAETDLNNFDIISQLSNLNRLTIQDCNLDDISFIKDLQNLNYINISDNKVSDITALSNLKNLSMLQIEENIISDISPISKLDKMLVLDASDNNISDIGPLKGLTRIISIGLDNNKVSDISSLSGMDNLQTAFLRSNNISDISPLANKSSMSNLALKDNKVGDFSIIESMTELTSIDLSGMGIKDIFFLGDCKKLEHIDLSYNKIKSIEPLKNCIYLESCYINNNLITDFTPMLTWQNLNNLTAYNNKCTDFGSLSYLTNLVNLSISIPELIFIDDIKKDIEGLLSTKYLSLTIMSEEREGYYDAYYHREDLMDSKLYDDAAKIDNIINTLFKPGISDYDKVKSAHDYLCENLVYNYEYYYEHYLKNVPEDYVFTTTTDYKYNEVLTGERTICGGYSNAFKFLMDKAGVECYYAVGMVGDISHAWNIVKLDGKYYNIDVTWDDVESSGTPYNYEYFLVSDEFLKKSRTWDESLYPSCPEKYKLLPIK